MVRAEQSGAVMLLYHDDGDAGPVVLLQLFLQAGSLCVIGLELVTIRVPGVQEPCGGVDGRHINVESRLSAWGFGGPAWKVWEPISEVLALS